MRLGVATIFLALRKWYNTTKSNAGRVIDCTVNVRDMNSALLVDVGCLDESAGSLIGKASGKLKGENSR